MYRDKLTSEWETKQELGTSLSLYLAPKTSCVLSRVLFIQLPATIHQYLLDENFRSAILKFHSYFSYLYKWRKNNLYNNSFRYCLTHFYECQNQLLLWAWWKRVPAVDHPRRPVEKCSLYFSTGRRRRKYWAKILNLVSFPIHSSANLYTFRVGALCWH